MKLPSFPSRKKSPEQLSKQDEKIFAEASELAVLRLEQCIADMRIPAQDVLRVRGVHPARKFTSLF